MNEDNVIRFLNLRQQTDTIGEYTEVKAKAPSFASTNAEGSVREVKDRHEVAELAANKAARTLILLNAA